MENLKSLPKTHSPLWLWAKSYRAILRETLAARKRINPRYSLRAFARDLKMQPSQLSAVLNEKEGISPATAEKISRILGFDGDEAEYFRLLVEAEHRSSRQAIAKILLRKFKARQKTDFCLDSFRLISDWYHFAILELFEVKGFQCDAVWIANTLGIGVAEVRDAVERLLRVGLLEEAEGKLRPATETSQVISRGGSEAIRSFHRQILMRAIQNLSERPPNEREFSASTFAFNKNDVPKVKRLIARFKALFSQHLATNASSEKDSIYCFSMQFFELTQPKEPKK